MNNTLGNIFGQQAVVAQPVGTAAPTTAVQPVTPVTPQPAVAGFGQQAAAPVTPVTPVTPVAPVPVANNLGGGGRLANIMGALKATKVGGGRQNKIALGTGLYLLKEGAYKISELNNVRLTVFSFICLKGIKDGMGVAFGGPGYSGAVPGEEYSAVLYHDGPYAYSSLLRALSACFGWSKDMVAIMQSDVRLPQTIGFIDMFTGVGAETQQPTNQPCCFSNQIILEMSSAIKVVEVKNEGKASFNEDGTKQTKSYPNIFWNKRVPIAEALNGLDTALCIKAFGSQEAITAALETEKQLDAFA